MTALPDPRPEPGTRYEHAFHALLDELFPAYPVWGTQTGFHLVDDRWSDPSDAGRLARVAMLKRHLAVFEELGGDELSADEVIDRGILLEALAALLFEEEVLRESAWDPLSYVYQLGSGFFDVLGREYAPFATRAVAVATRAERLPAVLEGARESLGALPDRPVSLLHTETALAQLSGVGELIDEALTEAARRESAGEDGAREARERLAAAAPAAQRALDGFRDFLDTELRATAAGEGRLGPELFAQKLRHTTGSELAPADLLARAGRDYDAVRAEMVRLARELWAGWIGEAAPPAGSDVAGSEAESELVRRVLDAIAVEHRQPGELLAFCQAEVERIERFCRDRAVIGLPDEPLRITWTPVFMRAYGGAFLNPPGPLDKGLSSYFWITPPGDDWPAERVESYLREDNDRMLRLLCIHEGIPGHYLQLAWSNRAPSLTRAIFWSGVFAEGWAVYVTQVMMDLGYASEDPAVMLIHWKFYLRAITNAIIDVLIHTADMSESEAMELMVRGGFQEEQEARQKWLRARLTSTQLSTYYLGSVGMWDLEQRARRAAAAEAGAEPSSVPAQRIVGGLGETPGFDYRRHLESVISHGTPPVKWLERMVVSQFESGPR